MRPTTFPARAPARGETWLLGSAHSRFSSRAGKLVGCSRCWNRTAAQPGPQNSNWKKSKKTPVRTWLEGTCIFKYSVCLIWVGNSSLVSIIPNFQISLNILSCESTFFPVLKPPHWKMKWNPVPPHSFDHPSGLRSQSLLVCLSAPASTEIFYKIWKCCNRRNSKNVITGVQAFLISNTLLFQLLADHTTHNDHSRCGVQAKHNTVYLQRRSTITEVLLPKETKPER